MLPFIKYLLALSVLVQQQFVTVVQCGVPDEINNGYIKSVTNTSYGGMAEYECNDGFAKNHMNPSVCGADGNWQDVPLCTCK